MVGTKPVCLTIAGSDSGGGAGIQADIKAMEANGVYAASVITAVTAQNTEAVEAAFVLPLDLIGAQIDAVCSDLSIASVKTGMLSTAEIVELVADRISRYGLTPVVVDPVMISKTGYALLSDEAVNVLAKKLLPLARLVTPNANEAERLSGTRVTNLEEAKEAARRIQGLGPENVLVKGGHVSSGEEAVDVLFDGSGFELFRAERLDVKHTHGIGCTFASAIAAGLAKGLTVPESIRSSKTYITEAIRNGLDIGSGRGPVDHFFFQRRG